MKCGSLSTSARNSVRRWKYTGARRLTVGHSRAMFVVDTSAGHVHGAHRAGRRSTGCRATQEFTPHAVARGRRFPVANVRWFEPTGEVLGQPFFVMDHITADQADDEGALDPAAAASLVRSLAVLHALEPTAYLPAVDPEQSTHILIEQWRNVGKSSGAPRVPLLDAAEMWLHQHAPISQRVTLVHGDAGPGNVLSAGGEAASDRMGVRPRRRSGRGLGRRTCRFAGHARCPATHGGRCSNARPDVVMTAEQWDYWEAFNLYKRGVRQSHVPRTVRVRHESGRPTWPSSGTAVHHAFLRRLVDIIARINTC